MDDRKEVLLNNEPLAFKVLPKQSNKPKQADCKDLGPLMDQIVLLSMRSIALVPQGVNATL